ncbi:hypothetical protein FIBSPDRAFT_934404 [Athelia psychrophila]|uniref:Uncharacterized protein n=1 Tax=Athelia psychrophila TaxID=1759441 RepID=A0A166FHL3_9AGAM|nr:hypothetical protein FIBSPDRAFT_934404 [Fibularhizoctonia sp. CBS 109695]
MTIKEEQRHVYMVPVRWRQGFVHPKSGASTMSKGYGVEVGVKARLSRLVEALSGHDSSPPARDCATPEESDKEKIVRCQPTETGIYGARPFVTRYHTTAEACYVTKTRDVSMLSNIQHACSTLLRPIEGGIELHGRRRNAGVLRSSQGMRAAVGGGGLDLEGGGELDPVGDPGVREGRPLLKAYL